MQTYNINDPALINTETYRNFINENPEFGYLRIRASAASGAVPISGLNITVSKIIDNIKVIFFEGATDSSGMISEISLPAPPKNNNNQLAPLFTTYQINATYALESTNSVYSVNIYDDIVVLQNIVITPSMNMMNRSDYCGY